MPPWVNCRKSKCCLILSGLPLHTPGPLLHLTLLELKSNQITSQYCQGARINSQEKYISNTDDAGRVLLCFCMATTIFFALKISINPQEACSPENYLVILISWSIMVLNLE